MLVSITTVISLCTYLLTVDAYRILCVFPMPSVSHQIVFKAYTQALAKQGHDIVIITTKPTLPKERPKDNITEIDIGPESFKALRNILKDCEAQNCAKRGFVYDMTVYSTDTTIPLFSTFCAETFKLPEIKNFIEDKNQHFDLIIMESIIEFSLILSKIFKAPVIYFSSFYGTSENYETMGAVSSHPFLYPQSHRNNFGGVTLWQKIKEIYWDWKLRDFYRKVKDNTDRLLKLEFGPDTPTVDELRENVELLLLNVHPIFDNNRPVPPSVVYLGALHLQPVQELPEDINNILDNSKNGVIYVSFGTIIQPSGMEKDILQNFLNEFESLPYDVLWRFDDEHLKNKPENLHLRNWFPQRDLLMHTKVKAFVTQGGLQSLDEGIDAGVPMVGIPMVADQWHNSHKTSQMGLSITLDVMTLTSEDLVKSIAKVIDDGSYRQNIQKMRSLIRDQPQKSLDRAVWWTEYVLRHGGAKHLRAPSANMTWSEYFMFDVFVPIVVVMFIVILILIFFVSYILRTVLRIFRRKIKQC